MQGNKGPADGKGQKFLPLRAAFAGAWISLSQGLRTVHRRRAAYGQNISRQYPENGPAMAGNVCLHRRTEIGGTVKITA